MCRTNVVAVKRVHWLRARAIKQRWEEEVSFVRHEMEWTVRYWLHKSRSWTDGIAEARQSGHAVSAGSIAYALRQRDLYRHMADAADAAFKSVNQRYNSPKP